MKRKRKAPNAKRNLWPFTKKTPKKSSKREVHQWPKDAAKVAESRSASKYRGVAIRGTGDGFTVGRDRDSLFDTLSDAKKFVDSAQKSGMRINAALAKARAWRKKNPKSKTISAEDILVFIPGASVAQHMAKKAFGGKAKKAAKKKQNTGGSRRKAKKEYKKAMRAKHPDWDKWDKEETRLIKTGRIERASGRRYGRKTGKPRSMTNPPFPKGTYTARETADLWIGMIREDSRSTPKQKWALIDKVRAAVPKVTISGRHSFADMHNYIVRAMKANPALKTIRLNLAKPNARAHAAKTPKSIVKFGKRNPIEAATQTYEEFHGISPKGVVEITEREHRHSVTSGVGKLLAWVILDIDGKRQRLLLAPGYRYTGPDAELFPDFRGRESGEWEHVAAQHKDSVLVSQAEQTERGKKYGQLFLKGGDQSVNTAALGLTARDQHEDMLLGTILRIWYRTAKSFEDEGKVKQNFFHDFGKQGSAGVCPLLTYQPLNPSMRVVGGRYYVSPPDTRLKGVSAAGVSPGIVG